MELQKLRGDNDSTVREALRDEAKRLIVDSTYSGRGHQTAGRRWSGINTWLGLPTTILTTLLASGAGLSALVGSVNWLTALLALLAAALTAVRGFLRPGEVAEEHALKGTRYISLRNDTRLFLNIDLISAKSDDELAGRVRELRQRYNELNETPPLHIPRKDYLAAKESIATGESSYEDDPVWKELAPDGKDS